MVRLGIRCSARAALQGIGAATPDRTVHKLAQLPSAGKPVAPIPCCGRVEPLEARHCRKGAVGDREADDATVGERVAHLHELPVGANDPHDLGTACEKAGEAFLNLRAGVAVRADLGGESGLGPDLPRCSHHLAHSTSVFMPAPGVNAP
jgi:hypothetical protein